MIQHKFGYKVTRTHESSEIKNTEYNKDFARIGTLILKALNKGTVTKKELKVLINNTQTLEQFIIEEEKERKKNIKKQEEEIKKE